MKKYAGWLLCVVMAACNSHDQPATDQQKKAISLGKTANSDLFNQSFEEILSHYYQLKNSFTNEVAETLINLKARQLQQSVDSFPLASFKADSMLVFTAQSYLTGISNELKGLVGEQGLKEKRKEFQMVGDQLYDLIRTVRYDRAIIYHFYCQSAFNEQGAYWLNDTKEITNPYGAGKKGACGEIRDSIFFQKE